MDLLSLGVSARQQTKRGQVSLARLWPILEKKGGGPFSGGKKGKERAALFQKA